MKDNRGFAITATIYGFLVLFLIILLCLLSTIRFRNNNSVILDEKISSSVFPDELSHDVSGEIGEVYENGKYHLRLFKGDRIIEGCYVYLPKKTEFKINLANELVYSILGNETKIAIYGGTDCTNDNIDRALLIEYNLDIRRD